VAKYHGTDPDAHGAAVRFVSGSPVTIGFNTRGRLRPSTSAFPYSIANRQASSASLKWPNTPDAQRAPFGFVTMTIDAKLPRSPAARGTRT
jgi:hypothetical protein